MARDRSTIWETVAILFAIVAMWPLVLRREGPVFQVLLYLALLVMIVVFVRRWKKFHRLLEKKREEEAKKAPGGKK